MYFVYILRSLKNNDIYVGSTENITKRFILHNKGKVKSTKTYRPWQLLEKKEFNSRSDAVKCERFLKTGQQKEILKRKYGHVAKRQGNGLQNRLNRFDSGRGLKKSVCNGT